MDIGARDRVSCLCSDPEVQIVAYAGENRCGVVSYGVEEGPNWVVKTRAVSRVNSGRCSSIALASREEVDSATLLAVASTDGRIYIQQYTNCSPNGPNLRTHQSFPSGHRGLISDVAFCGAPSDSLLVSVSDGPVLTCRCLAKGRDVTRRFPGRLTSICPSPDPSRFEFLATERDGYLYLVDSRTPELLPATQTSFRTRRDPSLYRFASPLFSADWNAGCPFLIGAVAGGQYFVWDIRTVGSMSAGNSEPIAYGTCHLQGGHHFRWAGKRRNRSVFATAGVREVKLWKLPESTLGDSSPRRAAEILPNEVEDDEEWISQELSAGDEGAYLARTNAHSVGVSGIAWLSGVLDMPQEWTPSFLDVGSDRQMERRRFYDGVLSVADRKFLYTPL